MVWTYNEIIPAGVTGLTDWSASLYGPTGTLISTTSSGFTELTGGAYAFTSATMPNGQRGSFIFSSSAANLLATASVTALQEYVDASVASRLASSGYTVPPTAIQNRQEMDSNSVGLAAIYARTDVAISSRMATFILPDNFAAMRVDSSGPVYAVTAGGDAIATANSTENLADSLSSLASSVGTPMQAGATVILDADQSNYAPAIAGDAMALTSGERATLIAAIWGATERTLSDFGTLVADTVTAVWDAGTRTLTAFGFATGLATESAATTNKEEIISHGDSQWAPSGVSFNVGSFTPAALAQLAGAAKPIVVYSPVLGADVTLTVGDSYYEADGRALHFFNSVGSWPDLTSADLYFGIRDSTGTLHQVSTGTVVAPTGAGQEIYVEVSETVTAELAQGVGFGDAQVVAVLASGHPVTLVAGLAKINPKLVVPE